MYNILLPVSLTQYSIPALIQFIYSYYSLTLHLFLCH